MAEVVRIMIVVMMVTLGAQVNGQVAGRCHLDGLLFQFYRST